MKTAELKKIIDKHTTCSSDFETIWQAVQSYASQPMSAEQMELGYYYPLFKFFSDEHGLTLLDSQLQDVIHECNKFIEPAITGENWKSEYDNCRALLQELFSLKVMKENLYKGSPDGKEYAERKPKAWEAAKQFLSTYQHEGLFTSPTVKPDGWVSVEEKQRLEQIIELKEKERQELANMCITKQKRIEELENKLRLTDFHNGF